MFLIKLLDVNNIQINTVYFLFLSHFHVFFHINMYHNEIAECITYVMLILSSCLVTYTKLCGQRYEMCLL